MILAPERGCAESQPPQLLIFGAGREWKLIEKLAVAIADIVLTEFKPLLVFAEVKKFAVQEARHVSVLVTRERLKS